MASNIWRRSSGSRLNSSDLVFNVIAKTFWEQQVGGNDLIKNLADAISTTDGILKLSGLYKTDNIFIDDILAKDSFKYVESSIVVSDGIIKDFYTQLSDILSISESFLKEIILSKELSDFITLSEEKSSTVFTKDIVDIVILSDAFIKEVVLLFSDVANISDENLKSIDLYKNDVLSVIDSISKEMTVIFIDIVSFYELCIAGKFTEIGIEDFFNISDNLIVFNLSSGTVNPTNILRRWSGSAWVPVNTVFIYKDI